MASTMSGAYLIDNIVLIVLCGILLFIAFLYFTDIICYMK